MSENVVLLNLLAFFAVYVKYFKHKPPVFQLHTEAMNI